MRCYNPDEITVAFDDERLVADAGLLLPATLAVGLGLRELLDSHVQLGQAPGRANVGDKAMTVVHALLAGGSWIDDCDRLRFPLVARCTTQRRISPLSVGDEVEVAGMAPEEECQHEMFVLIRWKRRTLAVPLAQLEGVAVDEQTRQAIEDWHYWVAQGYEL